MLWLFHFLSQSTDLIFLRDLSTFPPHLQLSEAEQDGHQPPQPPEGWRSPQPRASPQRPPRAISRAPAIKAIFPNHPISLCFSRHTQRGRAEGPGEAPPTPGVAPPPIRAERSAAILWRERGAGSLLPSASPPALSRRCHHALRPPGRHPRPLAAAACRPGELAFPSSRAAG